VRHPPAWAGAGRPLDSLSPTCGAQGGAEDLLVDDRPVADGWRGGLLLGGGRVTKGRGGAVVGRGLRAGEVGAALSSVVECRLIS
jgi:hypothetical protein